VGEQRLRSELAEAIRHGAVVIIGPIRQELLSGIREQAHFERLKLALQAFRDEPLETRDYEEAARFFNLCRRQGVQCGPVDILICAAAARRNWQVATSDTVLQRCLNLIAHHKGQI
jgi:predicted nucleic acid-binding protein